MAELVGDLDLAEFDISDAGLAGDAYHERLAAAREHGWLVKSPISYVVLDREAGEFFLRARQTAFPGREIAELFGITGGRLAEQIDANILNLTGDRHRRLRALVVPAFTPRAAAKWRPAMREIAASLWSELEDSRECEFVSWFAGPFTARTIGTVIGAPEQDAAELHRLSSVVQRQFDIRALAAEPERIERAVCELYDYVDRLLEQRRRAPAGDLLSTLLQAEAEGERLSGPECVNLVLNVLAGGVDTTAAQLAHAFRLFAAHPAQWQALAERPELVPRAVEEVLRFEPITPFTARNLHRAGRAPGRDLPGRHHRRGLRGACQPGGRARRGLRHHRRAVRRCRRGGRASGPCPRAGAHLRGGSALLPRPEPREG
jgi:cytochrome P450